MRKPAELGMSKSKLIKLAKFLGGFGCVTRNGYIVYTWGHPKTPTDVASAGKVFLSHFVFKAVEQGLIPSLDSPVSDFEPALKNLDREIGHKDARITWRQMIYQTSGYGQTEEPGAAFDYDDFATQMLWRVLFTKVYRQQPDHIGQEVLAPLLTKPMQCEDEVSYHHEKDGVHLGRFIISPRDFCRFGLLYMHEGNWNGQQLLDRTMARMAVSTPLPSSLPRTKNQHDEMLPGQQSIGTDSNQEDHLGSYSCMWWVNGLDKNGGRLWPDAPPDTYGAFGYGGNRAMVVIPSMGIVASWTKTELLPTDMSTDGKTHMNNVIGMLVQAAQP